MMEFATPLCTTAATGAAASGVEPSGAGSANIAL